MRSALVAVMVVLVLTLGVSCVGAEDDKRLMREITPADLFRAKWGMTLECSAAEPAERAYLAAEAALSAIVVARATVEARAAALDRDVSAEVKDALTAAVHAARVSATASRESDAAAGATAWLVGCKVDRKDPRDDKQP